MGNGGEKLGFGLSEIPFGAPQRERPESIAGMGSGRGTGRVLAIPPSVVSRSNGRTLGSIKDVEIVDEYSNDFLGGAARNKEEKYEDMYRPFEGNDDFTDGEGEDGAIQDVEFIPEPSYPGMPARVDVIEVVAEDREDTGVIDLVKVSPLRQAIADSERELAKMVGESLEDFIDEVMR